VKWAAPEITWSVTCMQHPAVGARAWTIVIPVPMILCILRVATDFTSEASINRWINRQIDRLRLGGQGPLQIRLSLQVVFGCCLCFAYCLCPYAGLTYSIVLSLHTKTLNNNKSREKQPRRKKKVSPRPLQLHILAPF
jgi:hypothetical protein